jgi:hypothetical protein
VDGKSRKGSRGVGGRHVVRWLMFSEDQGKTRRTGLYTHELQPNDPKKRWS